MRAGDPGKRRLAARVLDTLQLDLVRPPGGCTCGVDTARWTVGTRKDTLIRHGQTPLPQAARSAGSALADPYCLAAAKINTPSNLPWMQLYHGIVISRAIVQPAKPNARRSG